MRIRKVGEVYPVVRIEKFDYCPPFQKLRQMLSSSELEDITEHARDVVKVEVRNDGFGRQLLAKLSKRA